MTNRKSASKQAAGGNPQPANKNRATNTAGTVSSKPPTSSNQPKAQTRKSSTSTPRKQGQLEIAANRSSNGTKPQGTGNAAPKSQGANGLVSWIFGGAEATSGPKASQDRSMYQAAPKRTGSGPNNNPQKTQGHPPVPQSNVSSRPQAPKPKHSQPHTGGDSSAPNSVLTRPSPPRPGNTQPSLFSGVHGNKAGQKVFQDQSLTPKQNGHPNAHTQKAQNHAPTPQSFFSLSPAHQQPTNPGKNTANGPPGVQVATPQAPRGGQSPKGLESLSDNHRGSSHLAQDTSNKGHKSNPPKSTTNTPVPIKNVSPPPPISSVGSKGTGNRSSDSMNPLSVLFAAPSHPHIAQESSHKRHKNNISKPTMNDQSINAPSATKNVTPPSAKVSPSISGNGSSNPMNPSGSKRSPSSGSHQAGMSAKQPPAAAEGLGPLGWLSSLLPSAGPTPVQAMKKPTPNTSKGLESLPNGSQTRQTQVSNNSSMPKGTESGIANVPPKNGPTPNNSSTPANDKVRLQYRHVPETSSMSDQGNNNGGWSGPPPKKELTPANHKESRQGQEASNKDKGNNNIPAEDQSLGRGKPPPILSKKDSPHTNNKAHETSSASNQGNNNNTKAPSKPLAEDQSLGRGECSPTKSTPLVKTPSPTPVKAPQPPLVSAAPKGTGNRSSDSMNMNMSGSKRNSSNGSHRESSSEGARNMSTKSLAVPEGSGALGWLSSWFTAPAPDNSKQVQAMKIPSPSSKKAKGRENLPNGSQTRQTHVSDSSTLAKGTENNIIANILPKDGSIPTNNATPANKVHLQSQQVPKVSPASNKGNKNDISLKPWVQDQSLGRNESPILSKKDSTPANNKAEETSSTSHKGKNNISLKPCGEDQFVERGKPSPTKSMPVPHSAKTSLSISAETKGTGLDVKSATERSPKSSGSKHLSSHSSTADGGSLHQALPIVAQKQLVPSAQDILTAKLSSTQSSPHSQAAKNKGSSPKQSVTDSSQKPQAAAVPTLSLSGGVLNKVSSFFGWTKAAPSSPPRAIDKRVQGTNEPRHAQDATPKPLASTHQVPKSSKGDDNLSKSHPAPTSSSTSPGHKRPELSRKEVALSVEHVKNGPHDVRDRSGKLDTSASGTELMGSNATLPKEQTPDRHEGTSKLSRGTSSVSTKAEVATNLTSVSSHATDRAQKSSEHQSVEGSSTVKGTKSPVRHRKEFLAQSSSSKVLSQPPKKTTTLGKGLLRQYSPTLIWRASDSPKVVSAYSTLTAAPLPPPPETELQNKAACKTIARHPDLFPIVSPIKVDAFEKKLKDHPNPSYVESVVRGLRDGFWSWATSDPALPTTHDGSRQQKPITSKDKADFIQQQRNTEIELGRWSEPFGKKLLPGMHSSPINAVPKSTPGKFRLIVDQSRGPHALNSTIPKSQVKVKLDNVHDLGSALIAVRKKHPKRKLVLFKSDVKSAYRQLPMHPLWQIKQVVSIDGQRHVDRCNTFGNRGGGWNWDSFASLVNWIGTEKKKIPDLLGYVDDNFGWEFKGNTKYYEPYKKHLPSRQARLLELWDELGIPHDEDKQLSGPSLPILGYEVDANAMTVGVPDEKKAKVIQSLRTYAHEGTSYTLKELQSVAGSTSAVLSLYPRLRPRLRGLFKEMAGQEGSSTKLMVTKPVARTLSGLADYLERAQPVTIRERK